MDEQTYEMLGNVTTRIFSRHLHNLLLEKTGVRFKVFVSKYHHELYGDMIRIGIANEEKEIFINRDFKTNEPIENILSVLVHYNKEHEE